MTLGWRFSRLDYPNIGSGTRYRIIDPGTRRRLGEVLRGSIHNVARPHQGAVLRTYAHQFCQTQIYRCERTLNGLAAIA